MCTSSATSKAQEESSVRQEKNLWGRYLSTERMVYRTFVLRTVFEANLTIGKLERFKNVLNTKGDQNPNIGHASNLVSDYIGLIKNEEKEKIKKIIKDIYKEYFTIFDNSPIGDDAKAIAIRLVNKKIKKVRNLIILIKLYRKKLNIQRLDLY